MQRVGLAVDLEPVKAKSDRIKKCQLSVPWFIIQVVALFSALQAKYYGKFND
jgi:hypothetical protein